MANNLFVSYDLNKPGQGYEKVIEAIKGLGNWAKVHYSLWYVNSEFTATQARDKVWAVMDSNDKLIVVDATNNNATWRNLDDVVAKHILDKWPK